MHLRRLSDADVVEALLSVKSNAIGLDGINAKFIKLSLPVILPYITHIFNTILTTSVFPTEWKKAKIVPVPKKPNCNLSEYRPIAILPFLSKVFEKALLAQIQKHLYDKKLLSSRQSGFRSKRSCKTALLFVVDEIRKGLDSKELTFLTLLDFSKAFDTVNHSLLCAKLINHFSFSSQSAKLIHSYLVGRQQSVVVNGRMSKFLPMAHGVPQGSILGPVLFSLYVNELPNVVKYCSVHMYADDVQLFIKSPLDSIELAAVKMNDDLQNILTWAQANNLHLNPSKSKSLVIYRYPVDLTAFPSMKLGQSNIEYVDSARNLGLTFNRTLSWDDHINLATGKVYGVLRLLWASQSYTPLKTKLLLARTLILPILLYGCEVFCNVDYNSRRKLNVVYNNIARYIYNIRRFDHISAYSKTIFGCSFDNVLKYFSIACIFDIMQTRQPDYLFNKIQFSASQRTLALIQPRFSCLTSERQFFVHATRLWNSLPLEMRRIRSAKQFKSELLVYMANDHN